MISTCPSCKNQIQVPDEAVGKKVRCSGCQAVFVVEAASPAPPPPPPPKPEPPRKKKKTTDPPPKPAPPTVEMPPAPVKKKPEPAKKKPAPKASAASDNPFAFEGTGPAPISGDDGIDLASGLDFEPVKPKVGVATEYRLRSAAVWLHGSAIITILLSLTTVTLGVLTMFKLEDSSAGYSTLGGACCVALVLFVLSIITFIGASSFGRVRSRGMGTTAALATLVNGFFGLAGVIGMVVLMLGQFDRMYPLVALLCFLQFVVCVPAALRTVLVAFRADVKAAFAEKKEQKAQP